MENKKIVIILMIYTIIFTLVGGTFAYLNWESDNYRKTNITFTINPDFTCGADGGGNITSNDVNLIPADCTDSEYAIKRVVTTNVTTTGDKVVSLDLWLDINGISTNLSNSDNFKYVFSKNGNTCTSSIISQGTFKNKHNGDKVQLLSGVEYATLDDIYYLYIWLDKAETNSNTMNQSFDFSLGGVCQDTGIQKAYVKLSNSNYGGEYYQEGTYKAKITDIYFVYDEDLPSGIQTNNVKTYDLSNTTGKPITGYLIENTDVGADPDTYKLYVSSEYKIYAQRLGFAFDHMTNLKTVTFANFDTSEATQFDGLFLGCSNLVSVNVETFNTINATSMGSMFSGCRSLSSINVSNFNTKKVTTMGGMFQDCSSLSSLNVNNFDTSIVQNFSSMFFGCSGLTTLDVTKFNTSSANNMSRMFKGCNSLSSLDVSNFNTSGVSQIYEMFSNTNSLTTLDLSNFNTSSITDMNSMFQGSGVSTLDLTSFDTSIVTNMRDMFGSCKNLVSVDLSSFNTSSVNATAGMFAWDDKLTTIYVSNLWNTDAVTASGSMFGGCKQLPNFNTSVTDKTRAYYGGDGLGYLTYKAYPAS